MDRDQFSKRVEQCSAPWFNVPRVPVVGIEHPCLISDIGRAIDTLGGPEPTSKVISFFLDHPFSRLMIFSLFGEHQRLLKQISTCILEIQIQSP